MVEAISSGTAAIEAYWSHVERAEREIRANAHLGRLPPMCFGDPWDDDFAKAYERIHPLLKQYRRQRCYAVPAGLAFRSMPLLAETGHQGLMFFLNKPDELFGERGVLDSAEYKRIKTDAMEEWVCLGGKPSAKRKSQKPVNKGHRVSRRGDDFNNDDLLLHAFLSNHHGCNSDEPNNTPVGSQEFLAEQLRASSPVWNSSRVRRAMKRLMKDVKRLGNYPMERYNGLCKAEQICGYLTKLSLKMIGKGLHREFQVENLDALSDSRRPRRAGADTRSGRRPASGSKPGRGWCDNSIAAGG